MLDLNFVRENLAAVREGLRARYFPTEALDKFVELDVERRRIIGEADALNQARNVASKEIGDLIKAGKKPEAEAKKAEVAGLKETQSELEAKRDAAEAAMHDLLAGLPNVPAADVPVDTLRRELLENVTWRRIGPAFEALAE